jgi:hypothetical protein
VVGVELVCWLMCVCIWVRCIVGLNGLCWALFGVMLGAVVFAVVCVFRVYGLVVIGPPPRIRVEICV